MNPYQKARPPLISLPPLRLPQQIVSVRNTRIEDVENLQESLGASDQNIPASTSGSTFIHPFQIVAGSSSSKVQVSEWARLQSVLSTAYSEVGIDNLASDLTIASGYTIAIHATMSPGFDITSCGVISMASFGTLMAFSGTNQTDFWYPIGFVSSATGLTPPLPGIIVGSLFVEQVCYTNLRLVEFCTPSGPAIYPVPS